MHNYNRNMCPDGSLLFLYSMNNHLTLYREEINHHLQSCVPCAIRFSHINSLRLKAKGIIQNSSSFQHDSFDLTGDRTSPLHPIPLEQIRASIVEVFEKDDVELKLKVKRAAGAADTERLDQTEKLSVNIFGTIAVEDNDKVQFDFQKHFSDIIIPKVNYGAGGFLMNSDGNVTTTIDAEPGLSECRIEDSTEFVLIFFGRSFSVAENAMNAYKQKIESKFVDLHLKEALNSVVTFLYKIDRT